jgi:hypothetical protein
MGVGVPVLLVVADLSCEKCSFVCLNDYIDKILVPRHKDYKSKASRTIHVPIANDIALELGQTAIRWYGKRAKLYAAFQRFAFQAAELGDELSSPNTAQMAEYFATRIASYDFWNNTEMWGLIGYYGDALRRFLISGTPGIVKIDLEAVRHYANGNKERESEVLAELRNQEVLQLWRFLSVLPRNYEDVCRVWFLPTALGFTCSLLRKLKAVESSESSLRAKESRCRYYLDCDLESKASPVLDVVRDLGRTVLGQSEYSRW